MSEWELDQAGAHFELMPHVYLTIYDLLPGEKWAWQIAAIRHSEESFDVVVLAESQEDYDNWRAAQEAGLEASTLTLAKRIEATATAELRRIKRAAKEADAALRAAAAGEIVWGAAKVGEDTLHTASHAGQYLKVSEWADGSIRWQAIPGVEGQPSGGDAPSVEIGKVRAVAAILPAGETAP